MDRILILQGDQRQQPSLYHELSRLYTSSRWVLAYIVVVFEALLAFTRKRLIWSKGGQCSRIEQLYAGVLGCGKGF